MLTTLLSCGYPFTLLTNQVYALPACKVTCFTSSVTPTIEQSNDITFTEKSAITFTGGSAIAAGVYIRATAGNPVVTLKRD